MEPGSLADLVILEANPLDDIRNTKRGRGVMGNGVYRTLEELSRRPSQQEEAVR